jgi:hypothetical protein
MATRRYPPVPAFPSLRLATLRDIPRLAVVSTLGFRNSETFGFERSRYDQFPQDALTSFRNAIREQISDSNTAVIVAEDEKLVDDEDDGDDGEIQDNASTAGQRSRIVVGVST